MTLENDCCASIEQLSNVITPLELAGYVGRVKLVRATSWGSAKFEMLEHCSSGASKYKLDTPLLLFNRRQRSSSFEYSKSVLRDSADLIYYSNHSVNGDSVNGIADKKMKQFMCVKMFLMYIESFQFGRSFRTSFP